MSLMESLLNLDRVDAQVRGLRKRLDAARRYLDAQTKLHSSVEQQLGELETRKRHLQATIANLETEVAVLDQQLEKFRADLNCAVTNKQYSAVLTEMNTVKIKRSGFEDQILQHMEQVEANEKQTAEVREQLAERAKVRSLAEAQLAQRQADIGESLTELEEQRDRAAAAVPARELALFEHMAEVYDGEAMAQIEEIDRRHHEYACGACNMRSTFEQVSLLLGDANAVVRCTACDRILYMQDELRCELTPK